MHAPLYREAIRHGWAFAWHNKVLWILGLFAAAVGQMGFVNLFAHFNAAASEAILRSGWWSLPGYLAPGLAQFVHQLSVDRWLWLVWLLVIVVGFSVLFVFVAVSSQGALIHATRQSIRHRTIHVDSAWDAGVVHFWRLLGLNLVKKIILSVLGLAVGWMSFNALVNPAGRDVLMFVVFFFAAIVLAVIVSFLTMYAAAYVVVEEYPLGEAIDAAWRLFTEHWIVSLEAAVILLGFQIVATLTAVSGAVCVFVPIMLIWIVSLATASQVLFSVGVMFGMFVFFLGILLVAALYTSFSTAVWTYLFMKMHHEGVPSRLAHWLTKHSL